MKYRLLLVLATLPLVVNSYNFIEIPHTAAIQNVGKLRTVCGKVQSTYINSNTASQRIYLNMGREYPNHTFTGLIWYSSNKDNFDGRPDKKYKKKNICISGVISTNVVILGAGTVAEFAARSAAGLGANITIFDNSITKLKRLQTKNKFQS